MNGKKAGLAYGIRQIAACMIIPIVLMFIPLIVREFQLQVSTLEVELEEEESQYSDGLSSFKSHINGKERIVFAPSTAKTGDRYTVILRNGGYFQTAIDPDDLWDYTTVPGRFLRVCNNNLGYHVLGLAAVLLLTFLITLKKKKEIRGAYPKLSKITNITGASFSAVMSALMLFGAIDNTLTGVGLIYLGLFAGIIYTAVFTLAWIIEFIILNRYKET